MSLLLYMSLYAERLLNTFLKMWDITDNYYHYSISTTAQFKGESSFYKRSYTDYIFSISLHEDWPAGGDLGNNFMFNSYLITNLN